MIVSGRVRSDSVADAIEEGLRSLGLFRNYTGKINGDVIIITVKASNFLEVESVTGLLRDHGVSTFVTLEERAA